MAFSASLKVCFSDIDYAGIVYYPRFLHYFHVALEEFFSKKLGFDYATILIEKRIGFPTVHVESNFLKSLKYGDEIEIEVKIKNIGQSSITWAYRVYLSNKPNEILVTGQNVTVTIDLDTYKKIDTPSWLKQKLEEYEKTQ